jgi:hypothetical protein
VVDSLQGCPPSPDGVAAADHDSGTAVDLREREPTPAVAPVARTRRSWPRWLAVSALAALAATATLPIARTPTFDPLSWATWGRELASGQLVTAGEGASFKPLPVFFDAVVAVLHGDPTVAWVAVTRTAGIVALVLAFVLARRLGGMLAGIVAVGTLVLSVMYVWLSGSGMAEPVEMAAALAAVVCWLDGRRTAAVAWLTVLSLLRPEAWPFLALAGLVSAGWSWRRLAGRTLLGVVVLAAWFAPEYAGSGDLWRSVHRAGIPTNGGPRLTAVPGLSVVASITDAVLFPLALVAAATALAYASAAVRRRRWREPGLLVAAAAAAWLFELAGMAQAHASTGVVRYLAPCTALLAVLAGRGCAWLVERVASRAAVAIRVAAALAVGAVAVWVAGTAFGAQERVRTDARTLRTIEVNHHRLTALVALAGGRAAVNACGPVATGPYEIPLLAWELRRHLPDLDYRIGKVGTVLARPGDPPASNDLVAVRTLARAPWLLRSSCPAVAP